MSEHKVKIPKIIHQTYKSLDLLPEIWKNTPDEWKKYHEGWTYMFWSDEDCDELIKLYPQFLSTYNSFPHKIEKFDMIRLLFIYHHGGLYVDCDIIPTKNIDDLFSTNADMYIAVSSHFGNLTNAFIAGQKGSNFILRCLEEMVERNENPEWWYVGKHITVMNTTGPKLVEDMYELYKDTYEILVLNDVIPKSCDVCSEKPCYEKEGYVKVLEGSSWLEWDSKLYIFFYCNWKMVIFIFIILMCILRLN